MAIITKEQVAEYLKGLVATYGPSPSVVEATIYTRSTSSPVSPADVIRVFGVDNWGGVMTEYGRYLAANRPAKKEPISKPEPEPEPPDTDGNHRLTEARYFSRERMLQALADMYIEFNGEFTVQKVRERAKRTPTPSYTTLSEYFGPPKNWARIVEEETMK